MTTHQRDPRPAVDALGARQDVLEAGREEEGVALLDAAADGPDHAAAVLAEVLGGRLGRRRVRVARERGGRQALLPDELEGVEEAAHPCVARLETLDRTMGAVGGRCGV